MNSFSVFLTLIGTTLILSTLSDAACITTNPSDPNCLGDQYKKFVNTNGMGDMYDGTSATNKGPVSTPVVSQVPASPSLNNFYMYFAGAAYCEKTLPTLDCPWCKNITDAGYEYRGSIQNPIYNTRAFIAVSPNAREIVVSIRGTINIPNILTDFTFAKVAVIDNSPIRVHVGFQKALDSIYSEVIGNLIALLSSNPAYKVVVTGHSMGGAMGSLLLFRLKYFNVFPATRIDLYTYGSPRVGNKAFVDYMNGLDVVSSRVVERADMVPHMPAAFYGYYHHATESWIYNATTYEAKTCSRHVYEDATCSNSLGPLYTILDHGVYFDVNIASCVEQDPFAYIKNSMFNLDALTQNSPNPVAGLVN